MSTVCRILLIEDNPLDKHLFDTWCLRHDFTYQLEYAPNLTSSFEKILSFNPDIIFSDLGLPESQGIETVQHLVKFCPQIPLIVFTGSNDKRLSQLVIDAGAQDYIDKSNIDSVDLEKVTSFAIHRHQITKQLKDAQVELEFKNKNLQDEVDTQLQMYHENLLIKSDLIEQFLSDIQTPLTEISGAVTYLDDLFLPKDVWARIDSIRRCGGTISGLFEGLVDLSQVKSREIKIKKHAFNLTHLLDKLVDHCHSRPKEKQVTFACNLAIRDGIMLESDPVYLYKMLKYQINSAFLTTNTGSITLEGISRPVSVGDRSLTSESIELKVCNTGEPLSNLTTYATFEDFVHGKRSKWNFGDTNMSLSIASELSHLLDTRMSYEYSATKGNIIKNYIGVGD